MKKFLSLIIVFVFGMGIMGAKSFSSSLRSDYLNHWDYVYEFKTGVSGDLRLDYTSKYLKTLNLHFKDDSGKDAYFIKCVGERSGYRLMCEYKVDKDIQKEIDALEPMTKRNQRYYNTKEFKGIVDDYNELDSIIIE